MPPHNHNSQVLKEYRTISLSGRERLLSYHLPVMRVGILPRKKQWVNESAMIDCSFNIILSGSGYLRSGTKVYNIESPCMFTPTAAPGCTYGPNHAWEELYIIYPNCIRDKLKAAGYLSPTGILYPNLKLGNLGPILNELTLLMDNIGSVGIADRIDYLCEGILRESILTKYSKF